MKSCTDREIVVWQSNVHKERNYADQINQRKRREEKPNPSANGAVLAFRVESGNVLERKDLGIYWMRRRRKMRSTAERHEWGEEGGGCRQIDL